MRRTYLAMTLSLAVLPALGAQQKKTQPRDLVVGQACVIGVTAPWVKRQAEWFDESAHAWTNDTLRTALLRAAGLTAPMEDSAQADLRLEDAGLPPFALGLCLAKNSK